MKSYRLRSGTTFLEFMVTLPTAAVLIGVMGLSVTVMMRSKSQDDGMYRSAYDIVTANGQIASDLESATSLVSSSTTHAEIVVPDRNGDGLPEQIRYEWGGATGANANKLLWKYNSEPLSTLFDGIGGFSLQTSATTAASSVPNHLLSDVAILKSLDALPGAVYKETIINSSNAIGEYFIPSVSNSALWDLGSFRIMVRAADSNLDGVLRVQVNRSDSSKLPIAPVLCDITIPESRLGTTYQWLDIPIAPVSRQSASTPLVLTLRYASGTGNVARVQYVEIASGTGMPANANLLTSSNGGSSWTASDNTRDLRFYAYGYFDGYTGRRSFLSSAKIKLQSTGTPQQKIETLVRVHAKPELP